MTVKEIIVEALHDPQNWTGEGEVNWSFVDSDLWLHPDAANFEDQELFDGLNNFPDSEIPMTELIDGVHTPVNARVTHPLP